MEDNTQRLFFLDICRMIALWYMFFQHGVISALQASHWNFFSNLNIFVPICSALFLFICGFTLTLQSNRKKFTYFLYRGLVYWFISFCLFAIENGFQFPDIVFTSNILNTIAILIMYFGITTFFNKNIQLILSIIFTITLTLLFLFFDFNDLFIFPFTNGYEPILPTLIFGFIGICSGLLYSNCKNKNVFFSFLFTIGLIGIIIITIGVGYYDSYTAQIGRHKIFLLYKEQYQIQHLFSSTKSSYMTSIWNFNYISFISALSSVLVIISIIGFFEKYLHNIPKIILLPGQTAISNYLFHLAIWAIIYEFFGANCLNNIQFSFVLLLLFISSYFVGYLQVKIKNYIYQLKFDN